MAYLANKTLATTVSQYSARLTHRNLRSQVGLEADPVSIAAATASAAGTIAGVVDAYNKKADLVNEGSLTEYTQAANLEPRVMIEESLRLLPSMPKFMMTLTNIYAAYYLQAISLSATVGGVTVLSQLEKFNPNRKTDYSKYLNNVVNKKGLESAYVLPNFKKEVPLVIKPSKLIQSLEAVVNQHPNTDDKGEPPQGVKANTIQRASKIEIKSAISKMADIDSLAVGRILDVALRMDKDSEVHVPVAVRMRPMSVPSLIMRELIALGDVKESWSERWYRMRSGEISFWSDWVFQSDRIRNKRKLLALDENGLYRDMLERRKDNRLAAIKSGQCSIGAASAFILVTPETLKNVEQRTGAPITHPEVRNAIFKENSAMMIIVVDADWEQITMYTRGVNLGAQYTFKEFEGMSKGNGPDIGELMKAFNAGVNPRF